MITASVVLDLSRDSEASDRKATGALYGLPDGARVILDVGARTFPPVWTVRYLQEFSDRLHFDVHGDASAVGPWVRALRDGSYATAGWCG